MTTFPLSPAQAGISSEGVFSMKAIAGAPGRRYSTMNRIGRVAENQIRDLTRLTLAVCILRPAAEPGQTKNLTQWRGL